MSYMIIIHYFFTSCVPYMVVRSFYSIKLLIVLHRLLQPKYFLVSVITTSLNAHNAIRFGKAISPLKISANIQTADTVINGPIKTARI